VTLLDDLTGHTEDIARDVLALCQVESPSKDLPAQAAVTELAEELGSALVGRRPERIVEQDRPALLWAPEPGGRAAARAPGHGVADRHPRARPRPLRTADAISAPGVFDMKAGVVQAGTRCARSVRRRLRHVADDDEEIGSPVFRR